MIALTKPQLQASISAYSDYVQLTSGVKMSPRPYVEWLAGLKPERCPWLAKRKLNGKVNGKGYYPHDNPYPPGSRAYWVHFRQPTVNGWFKKYPTVQAWLDGHPEAHGVIGRLLPN